MSGKLSSCCLIGTPAVAIMGTFAVQQPAKGMPASGIEIGLSVRYLAGGCVASLWLRDIDVVCLKVGTAKVAHRIVQVLCICEISQCDVVDRAQTDMGRNI